MLVAMVIFALTSNAQTLLGIPFSGDAKVFASKLVAKGFVPQKNTTTVKNLSVFKGIILGKSCEVYVFGTAKTNQVFKMIAYTDRETTFSDITSTFDVLNGYLEEKYGKNQENECIDFFKSPYERGDGYEMTAIRSGKYVRMCVYGDNEPNMSVMLSIEKFSQVKITWENDSMQEVQQKELKERAKNEL